MGRHGTDLGQGSNGEPLTSRLMTGTSSPPPYASALAGESWAREGGGSQPITSIPATAINANFARIITPPLIGRPSNYRDLWPARHHVIKRRDSLVAASTTAPMPLRQ